MRTLFILGWEILRTEGKWEERIPRSIKAREGGILKVKISSLKLSHDVKYLNSDILKEGETSFFYGAAFSAVDRALQLGISELWEKETARLEINLLGKYVHEMFVRENVKVVCELTYAIVTNGKEAFNYSPQEKLELGMKIKEIAMKKHNESNVESTNYTLPVYLSTFLCLVRAIKWLSLILTQELPVESEKEFELLKQQCYNNICHFHLKFENFEKAVSVASVVLELDASNVKALYRRGVANLNLQNYDLAEVDLLEAMRLEPSNVAAKKKLSVLNEKKKILDNAVALAMKEYLASS